MNDQVPAPSVLGWQALYEPNALARCVKDNPPMVGFGRQLKTGDVVPVHGVCYTGTKYQISVEAECAFYDLEGFFEVQL